MKTEYFINARSFAAPFVSDNWSEYIKSDSPRAALEQLAKNCTHPAGLFAAECYASADDFHKGKPFLAEWLSNHVREQQRLTKEKGTYSYFGHGPGDFEINGERHKIQNPKEGSVT